MIILLLLYKYIYIIFCKCCAGVCCLLYIARSGSQRRTFRRRAQIQQERIRSSQLYAEKVKTFDELVAELKLSDYGDLSTTQTWTEAYPVTEENVYSSHDYLYTTDTPKGILSYLPFNSWFGEDYENQLEDLSIPQLDEAIIRIRELENKLSFVEMKIQTNYPEITYLSEEEKKIIMVSLN